MDPNAFDRSSQHTVMLRWLLLASSMACRNLNWCSEHPETPSMKAHCVAVLKHMRLSLRMLVYSFPMQDIGAIGLKHNRSLGLSSAEFFGMSLITAWFHCWESYLWTNIG